MSRGCIFLLVFLQFACLLSINTYSSEKLEFSISYLFYENPKMIKQTNKILASYDIYFILPNNQELKGKYRESKIIFNEVSNADRLLLHKEKYVLVRLQRRRHCFYTLFKIDMEALNVDELMLYGTERILFGFVKIKNRRKHLGNYLRSATNVFFKITHMQRCEDFDQQVFNNLIEDLYKE